MTIDEAIEIKEKDLADNYYGPNSKFLQAEKLSIEALRAYAQARRLGLPLLCDLLPGETKE